MKYYLQEGPFAGHIVDRPEDQEVLRVQVGPQMPDEEGKIEVAVYQRLSQTDKMGRFKIGAMRFRGIERAFLTLTDTKETE